MQGLSAGHAIVEGIIFAARRQSARDLAHNLNDLPHDIKRSLPAAPSSRYLTAARRAFRGDFRTPRRSLRSNGISSNCCPIFLFRTARDDLERVIDDGVRRSRRDH
jgi:uncharacterized protein YjeT (DUF2065 family)